MTTSIRSRRTRSRRVRAPIAALLLIGLLLATALTASAGATSSRRAPKPTIVLVHGAFADASGWSDVATTLQRRGFAVLATANPLRSVDGDSAYLRSILDTIQGPVVLVGHSYGGFVMTNAAHHSTNVVALVYIAAFAPDTSETVGGLTALNPGSGLGDPSNLIVRSHPDGADGYINPATFRSIFAADVAPAQAAVLAASQRPANVATLSQPSGPPAWAEIPSWYLVASEDNTIPPATQRFMAQRARATTIEVTSSHVVMISHPQKVTRLILDAADHT